MVHYLIKLCFFISMVSMWGISSVVAGEYTVNTGETFAFPLQDGWPVQMYGTIRDSCVIADLDNDSMQEVGFNCGGNIYIVDRAGSSFRNVWPNSGPAGAAPITFSDLTNDGILEIIVGTVDLYVYDINGMEMPGWPYDLPTDSYINSSPAVSCLDEFSHPVVVSGVYALNKVYIWNMFGQPLPNWPKATIRDSMYSAALVDLDTDGTYEVAYPFIYGLTYQSGSIQIYDKLGNIAQGIWDVDLGEKYGIEKHILTDLTVGDVDGDSYPEIMVGLHYGALVLNHDTTIATGFPKDTHSNVYGGLTCGDIDGDDKLEIACVTSGSYDDHNIYFSRLYVWNGEDGTDVENWPVNILDVSCVGQSVIIGDIDGDCDRELLVACHDNYYGITYVYAYHHDGTLMTGFPLQIDDYLVYWNNNCFITDIDNDGDVEIGVGLNDGSSYSRVYIWDLPYPYHEECQDWPQYNHDAQHTGNFHYKPIVPQVALPTLTPWAILLLVLLLSPVLVRQR